MAKPGLDQNVLVGTATQLDGSASVDADNDLLTYSWSILSRPSGSNALIPSPAVVQPTFTPDVTGTYIVQLIVNDGFANSQPVNVTITAVDSFRFSLTPNPLNLDTVASGSVRISVPFAAGSGGQEVLLQSFDTGVATVPSSAQHSRRRYVCRCAGDAGSRRQHEAAGILCGRLRLSTRNRHGKRQRSHH